VLVRLNPDLAGPGPEDPVCTGCDLVFDTGDQLLGAADPITTTTVTLRDDQGQAVQQQTNSNPNGRQIVLFAVDEAGNYEVELTVPTGWELCPTTSAVIQITAADFDASGFARRDYFLWRGCQPPTETPTATATATLGPPTSTPEGYPSPGDTPTVAPPTATSPRPTVAPPPDGDVDDDDDEDGAPAAAPSGSGGIRGLVFVDENGDGKLGAAEPGVGGVTVRLAGPAERTTTTTTAGTYEFSGLAAGSYDVSIAPPPGWRASSTDRFTAVRVEGGSVAGIDFGLARGAGAGVPGLPATGVLPGGTGTLLGGLAALAGVLAALGLAAERRRGRSA
jgi:hypothetical protein